MWGVLTAAAFADPLPQPICHWHDAAWERGSVPLMPEGEAWEFANVWAEGEITGSLGYSYGRVRFRGTLETDAAVLSVDIDPGAYPLFHSTRQASLGKGVEVLPGGDVRLTALFNGPYGAGAQIHTVVSYLSWKRTPSVWLLCEQLDITRGNPPTFQEATAALELGPPELGQRLTQGEHPIHKKPGKKELFRVTADEYHSVGVLETAKGWTRIAGYEHGSLWWGWVATAAVKPGTYGVGGLGLRGDGSLPWVSCTARAPLVAHRNDRTSTVGELKTGEHLLLPWPEDWTPEMIAVASEAMFPVQVDGITPAKGTRLFAKRVPGCSPSE